MTIRPTKSKRIRSKGYTYTQTSRFINLLSYLFQLIDVDLLIIG